MLVVFAPAPACATGIGGVLRRHPVPRAAALLLQLTSDDLAGLGPAAQFQSLHPGCVYPVDHRLDEVVLFHGVHRRAERFKDDLLIVNTSVDALLLSPGVGAEEIDALALTARGVLHRQRDAQAWRLGVEPVLRQISGAGFLGDDAHRPQEVELREQGADPGSVGESALAVGRGRDLRTPFSLGDRGELMTLFAGAGMAELSITTHPGTARFPSVAQMVEADLRGWLPVMGVNLTEDDIRRIVEQAQELLQPYVTREGTVAADVKAHILTARRT